MSLCLGMMKRRFCEGLPASLICPPICPRPAVALGLLFLLLPLLLFLTFFTPAGLGGLGGFGFLPPLALQVDVAAHFFLPLLFAMMLCSITAGDILA